MGTDFSPAWAIANNGLYVSTVHSCPSRSPGSRLCGESELLIRALPTFKFRSVVAGSDIVYPFGRLTASWLAARWGDRLVIEWEDVEDADRLTRTLILFALGAYLFKKTAAEQRIPIFEMVSVLTAWARQKLVMLREHR